MLFFILIGLDYFNSLLLHNAFFQNTQYELVGFMLLQNKFQTIVKQKFITISEITQLDDVKNFY